MLKTARNLDEEHKCLYCGCEVKRTDEICFELDIFPKERVCWHVCPGCRKEMRRKSQEYRAHISIREEDILC